MKYLLATLIFLPALANSQALNPTVTQKNIFSTICKAGWTKTVRPPVVFTDAVKYKLLAAANIPRVNSSLYELDHQVPLELGGAPRDLINLHLQRWAGPNNAHVKDALENSYRQKVCAGSMSLADARTFFISYKY